MATRILHEPAIAAQEQARMFYAPLPVNETQKEVAALPCGEPLLAGRTGAGLLPALTEEGSDSAEMFRVLANRLAGVRRAMPLKTLHITSCLAGEGKSVIAANLAITLARRPQEGVLLIEGDLRRPSLAQLFAATDAVGIGEWWQNTAPLPCVYPVAGTGLSILFACKVERPQDAMLSPRLPAMLQQLSLRFDWIIIDSPPLLPVVDAARWAAWADGTLLVVRAGSSGPRDMRQALARLDRACIVGTVLNEASGEGERYSRQYYAERPHKISA